MCTGNAKSGQQTRQTFETHQCLQTTHQRAHMLHTVRHFYGSRTALSINPVDKITQRFVKQSRYQNMHSPFTINVVRFVRINATNLTAIYEIPLNWNSLRDFATIIIVIGFFWFRLYFSYSKQHSLFHIPKLICTIRTHTRSVCFRCNTLFMLAIKSHTALSKRYTP